MTQDDEYKLNAKLIQAMEEHRNSLVERGKLLDRLTLSEKEIVSLLKKLNNYSSDVISLMNIISEAMQMLPDQADAQLIMDKMEVFNATRAKLNLGDFYGTEPL